MATLDLEDTALAKPPHGSPCNGCGLCCREALCDLGAHVFKRQKGPCPALEREPNSAAFRCGLVVRPKHYAPTNSNDEAVLLESALLLIGANFCCDAQLVGERRERGFDKRLRRRRAELKDRMVAALTAWGLRPWLTSYW